MGGLESFLTKKFSTMFRLLPPGSVCTRITSASVVTPATCGAALKTSTSTVVTPAGAGPK